MSEEIKSQPISWYRTPLDGEVMKRLHERSDFMGALQTLGYLGVIVATAGAALYSFSRWPWYVTVLLVFAHGTVFAFQINAVHELGHNTVFKTRWLNEVFVRLFAFLGWIHFKVFDASHTRHHRYTLHPPDDLEVVLPEKFLLRHFLKRGFVNIERMRIVAKEVVRLARGEFQGKWELFLFPESEPAKRRGVVNWARTLLIGHGLILALSVALGLTIAREFLLVPMLSTFGTFYGQWLFFSCNSTQHIGLQDNVPDFRLCCRTFTLNPFVRLLYWQMNYHIEHHMYAAVPCYKLGQLHRLIEHDLPPSPRGIIATWKEIAAIQKRQKQDPDYQYVAPLPSQSVASTGGT
jgi:fatty acid desaturase